MTRVCVIDCQTSGISGDKFLATLIDLGADEERIQDAFSVITTHLDGCRKIKWPVAFTLTS